jgi:demethylmenaquinone methyltransferase / 2-methoxy-6-polyprenyl-1,4-benzoquinol methylase
MRGRAFADHLIQHNALQIALARQPFYCDNAGADMPPTAATPPAPATVDKSGPRVRRMFGEIAGRYDFLNHLLSLNIDRHWRRRTVKLVPPRPGCRILDVCTGTGDLALAYLDESLRDSPSQVSEKLADVTGADFCHEMLTLARQKARRAGVEEQVVFIEADAQRLPLASDLYDIVCVAFGLRNVADTMAGLAEMTRVCAPGGQVAVLEFSSPARQPFKSIYSWYFRRVLPRIGGWFAGQGAAAYRYLPASVGEFPQGEALAAMMRSCGLVDVELHALTLGVATLYVGRKPPAAS